ncbi:DUF6093 family protein [Leifsonia sp. NPDC014704]|uniref:DUF6093 family protein n=1 Tax=Leifsonia sp. NPDC014704 TaxID=3364123 RepID=UPI0036F497CD
MNLGEEVRRVLPELQAAAESAMGDTCVIRKQTGQTTAPGALAATPTFAEVYTGPCKVQFSDIQPAESESPGQVIATRQLELHLPAGTTGVTTSCVAEITAAGPESNTRVGAKLRVLPASSKTYMTARRYPVEEVS